MSPAEIVRRTAELIGVHGLMDVEKVTEQLRPAGIPSTEAARAFFFTQTAWSRVVIEGVCTSLSDDYLIFNAAGEVVESGQLADQPYYAAARECAEEWKRSPHFTPFVFTAAETNALNNAVRAGAKPEDLALGPVAIFLETPSRSGVRRAQIAIQCQLDGIVSDAKAPCSQETTPRHRPWWRFWG